MYTMANLLYMQRLELENSYKPTVIRNAYIFHNIVMTAERGNCRRDELNEEKNPIFLIKRSDDKL